MPPGTPRRARQVRQRRARLSADEKRAIPRLGGRRLARRKLTDLPLPPRFVGDGESPARHRPGDAPGGGSPAEGSMPYELVEIDPKADARRYWRSRPRRSGPEPGGRPPRRRPRPAAARRREGRRGRRRLPRRLPPPGPPARGMPRRRGEADPGRVGGSSSAPLRTPRGQKQVDRSRIGLVFAEPAAVHKELMSGMAAQLPHSRSRPGRATTSRGPISGSRGPRCSSRSCRMHLRERSRCGSPASTPAACRGPSSTRPPVQSSTGKPLYPRRRPKPMPEGTIRHTGSPLRQLRTRTPNNPDPRRVRQPSASRRGTRDARRLRQLHPRRPGSHPGHAGLRQLAAGQYKVTFRHRPAGPASRSQPSSARSTDWAERPVAIRPGRLGGHAATIVLRHPGPTSTSSSSTERPSTGDPGNPASVVSSTTASSACPEPVRPTQRAADRN